MALLRGGDDEPEGGNEETKPDCAGGGVVSAEVDMLRRRLEFFQGAVDALPFALFWKDVDSVYMGSNRRQAERAGLPSGGAIEGLSDAELPWTADEVASFRADDRVVIVTGEPSSQIIETQRVADTADRICRTHKAPLRNAEGEIIGLVGWYEDITNSVEKSKPANIVGEDRLRNEHKLDSLGALAGGIAHDFNNILAAIVANVTVARDALPSEHPAAENLDDIDRAAARALELVRQILSMSRPKPAQLCSVSLSEVVLEACRFLRATIPAGIEIVTRLDPEVPDVMADPTQLHQVVVNLATNAQKAIDEQASGRGCIEIIVTHQDIDGPVVERLPGSLVPGRYAMLSVRDDGIGMDESTRERVFEPFFTTRSVGEGTGLGMSVVHGIVSAHQGAITITSAPRRGTTVRVLFPEAQRQTSRNVTRTRYQLGPSTQQKGGNRVLYLDDETALVRAISRILRSDGYHVTTFTDAPEALAVVRDRPDDFDLLVVDYNMPHLSGLDITREVLALRLDVPIVIVSGFVTEELLCAAKELGATAVIDKANLAADLKVVLSETLACP